MINNYNDFLNENKFVEEHEDVENKVKNSKKLSKEQKDIIIPLIINNGIHGSSYNNGRVFRLNIPKIDGKTFDGVDLGADKNGFFVFTHRARSKSYETIDKIPQKDINFIETTG